MSGNASSASSRLICVLKRVIADSIFQCVGDRNSDGCANTFSRFSSPAHSTRPSSIDTPSDMRSDEHTSELQSLMRTSYAAFCLTKKNDKATTQPDTEKHKSID